MFTATPCLQQCSFSIHQHLPSSPSLSRPLPPLPVQSFHLPVQSPAMPQPLSTAMAMLFVSCLLFAAHFQYSAAQASCVCQCGDSYPPPTIGMVNVTVCSSITCTQQVCTSTFPSQCASASMLMSSCSSTGPTNTYSWVQTGTGTCSTSCSGGTQSISYECQDQNGNVASSSDCSTAKPSNTQSCNTQSCESTAGSSGSTAARAPTQSSTKQTCIDATSHNYTYKWRENGVSACTALCGGGTHTIIHGCYRLNSSTEVEASCCTGPNPSTTTACNTQACVPGLGEPPASGSYVTCGCCLGGSCSVIPTVGYASVSSCAEIEAADKDPAAVCMTTFQQCVNTEAAEGGYVTQFCSTRTNAAPSTLPQGFATTLALTASLVALFHIAM